MISILQNILVGKRNFKIYKCRASTYGAGSTFMWGLDAGFSIIDS